MSERIRIEQFEAEDVARIVAEYREKRIDFGATRNAVDAEDLVNQIGEIYERALSRKGQLLPR
jgi:hypothetical protein